MSTRLDRRSAAEPSLWPSSMRPGAVLHQARHRPDRALHNASDGHPGRRSGPRPARSLAATVTNLGTGAPVPAMPR